MNHSLALVTGASRGIGRAIALRFAEAGWDVAIVARQNQEKLDQVRTLIESHHVLCYPFLTDVGERDAAARIFDALGEQGRNVEVLVNNAGISHIGLLQDTTWEEWQQILQTNLTGCYAMCKEAIPSMIWNHSGRILNISSVWGLCGASCEVAYSATKGGLHALTKALAKELAPSNIQVNAIACGAIDTDMNAWLSDEERRALEEEIPAGRLGRPEEVAQLALQLVTGNEYLTGQIIALDGGWV
ncbi:MAG: SDR family oxidoreductase [Lachnospiraceae bacterium]|nr:SDR family oxidoreductase [Lachnospiraceae bacterium]